jgi:acyl-coenzyme A synthetase/AMP-(fatty) acid ligase
MTATHCGAAPAPGRIEGDGWVATPHIRPDHRGPTERPFIPFFDPAVAPPIMELLSSAAGAAADRIVFDDGQSEIGFASFEQAVRRLAAHIERDETAGPVAVLLPTGILYAASIFACMAARRLCLLLDSHYPSGHVAAVAARAGAGLLIVDGPKAPAELRFMPRLDAARAFAAEAPQASAKGLEPDAPAFILATSGSSGEPKLVVHSQKTMLHWVRTLNEAMHIGPDDRVLSVSSSSTLGGFTSLLTFPLCGAASQMFEIKTGGLSGLFDILARRPVTILRAAPSLLRALCQHPDLAAPALARLRIVQTYGEPLLKTDVALLRAHLPTSCRIRTTYGSTEASGLSWYAGEPDDHDDARVATGTLMPDTKALIADERGRPCAPGEAGELWISSRYNALGEWKRGKLDRRLFPPDPGEPGARMFRTGDLARCSEDGVFVVLGRKDRMIKVNGQRVEPGFVEAALRRLGCVADAEVVSLRRGGKDRLLAFVVPASEAGEDYGERVRSGLAASLPTYMLPSRIMTLAAIPRLPGGKADLAGLLSLARAA